MKEVERSAHAADRSTDDITTIAVSKMHPAATVAQAAQAGQRHFGESRANELRDKHKDPALRDVDDLVWHFVGRLQTNKVKHVVGTAALVHSLDRWSLAEALDQRATAQGIVQRVLLQVNVDDDPAKAGVDPSELPLFVDQCAQLQGIRVEGLMTIPEQYGNARSAFAALRRLREQVSIDHPAVIELSMGMSADYPAAIAEGATMIRPGQAIFGPRPV
jgi:pyridoxal phosphate enzyme (YggS family)